MSPKKFSYLFVFLVALERVTAHVPDLNFWHYLAKPAIVISLIFYFFKQSKLAQKKLKYLTISALLFSVLGDVLLMFVQKSSLFFMAGLGAFLVAHILYIYIFSTKRNKHLNYFGVVFILLLYASVLFYVCKDNLGDMLIPVSLYIVIILMMATMAFLRKNNVNKASYTHVLFGSIIFILSDSVLALNKFYLPFNAAGDIIMITYALAQYLIIFGLLKEIEK